MAHPNKGDGPLVSQCSNKFCSQLSTCPVLSNNIYTKPSPQNHTTVEEYRKAYLEANKSYNHKTSQVTPLPPIPCLTKNIPLPIRTRPRTNTSGTTRVISDGSDRTGSSRVISNGTNASGSRITSGSTDPTSHADSLHDDSFEIPVAKFLPPPTVEEIPESPLRTTSPVKSGVKQNAHSIQTRHFSGIPESPCPSSPVKAGVLEKYVNPANVRSFSDNLFKDHLRNRVGYRQHLQELVDHLGLSSDNVHPVPFSAIDSKERTSSLPSLVSDRKPTPELQNHSPFPPQSGNNKHPNNENEEPHDRSDDLVQDILSNAEAVEDRAIIAEEKLRLLDQENDKLRKSNKSWRNLVERFEDILVSMNSARSGSGNRFAFADEIKEAETRECERKAFEERILEMERKIGGASETEMKRVDGVERASSKVQMGGKGGWEKEIEDLQREIGLLAKHLGLSGSEDVQSTSQTEAVSERKRLEALVKSLSEQQTALLAGTEELHDRIANLISEKARLVDENNQNREEQIESNGRIRELQDLVDAKIHENRHLSARINFLESSNKIEIQSIGWDKEHKAFSLLKDEIKNVLELLSSHTKDLSAHFSLFKPASTINTTLDEEIEKLKLLTPSSEEKVKNLTHETTCQATRLANQTHELATKEAHITNLKHRISLLETDISNLLNLNIAYAEYQAWYQTLLQTYSNMNASLDIMLAHKSAELLAQRTEIENLKRGEEVLRNDVEGQMTYIAQLMTQNESLLIVNLALEKEKFLSARTIRLFDDELKVFNQHMGNHILQIQAFEDRVMRLENDKMHILNGRKADVLEHLRQIGEYERQIGEFEKRVMKLESEQWDIWRGIGELNSDHVDEIVALQDRIDELECEMGKCGHVNEIVKLDERIKELEGENLEILKGRPGVEIDNLNFRKEIEGLKVALLGFEDAKMLGECVCGIDKSFNDERLSNLERKVRELYLERDRLEEENHELKVKDHGWEDKKDTLEGNLIVVKLERDGFRDQMYQLLVHREELRQKNDELSGRIEELSQESKELARKVKSYETHAGRRHFTLPGETSYTLPSSPLEKGFANLAEGGQVTPSKEMIPKIKVEDEDEDGGYVAEY